MTSFALSGSRSGGTPGMGRVENAPLRRSGEFVSFAPPAQTPHSGLDTPRRPVAPGQSHPDRQPAAAAGIAVRAPAPKPTAGGGGAVPSAPLATHPPCTAAAPRCQRRYASTSGHRLPASASRPQPSLINPAGSTLTEPRLGPNDGVHLTARKLYPATANGGALTRAQLDARSAAERMANPAAFTKITNGSGTFSSFALSSIRVRHVIPSVNTKNQAGSARHPSLGRRRWAQVTRLRIRGVGAPRGPRAVA